MQRTMNKKIYLLEERKENVNKNNDNRGQK